MPKLDITLDLDCWSDELSPTQLAVYENAQQEHNALNKKFKDLLVLNNGEEIFSGDIISAYQFNGIVQIPEVLTKTTIITPTVKASTTASTAKRTSAAIAAERISERATKSEVTVSRASKRKTPHPPPRADEDEDLPLAKRVTKTREKEKLSVSKTQTPTGKDKKVLRSNKSTEKEKIASPNFRPSEITSIGGLTVGVDVKEDNSKFGPDSKEVTFNKLQGKTFPSLVVLARPSLRVKDSSNLERNALDSKVKIVLMLTPAKFTEWLIQQGLLKSEQKCSIHTENELKLGVYSDGSKFPYSGGYVWISECCPTRFVSVFHGSLFEGAPNPPSCILKLIYHWSCQTNIQNVVQWVKVDNIYIKGIYTWLRAVCTLAIHKHFKPMGGSSKFVEVGVISLGTTTQDGAQRQVKVEVLGVLDHSEKSVRLRAIEPCNDAEKNFKKRFAKILEPLNDWVHKDSVIVIDLTVDKNTLYTMGFKNVLQCAATDTTAKHTNSTVMDYLRRIVPRMFQNTLSLLSRQMIQQFLDELVWREQYGTFPLQTFDSITTHIAEQTKFCGNETLVQRLFQVATNPFKDWSKVESDPIPSTSKESSNLNLRRARKTATKDSLATAGIINSADYEKSNSSSDLLSSGKSTGDNSGHRRRPEPTKQRSSIVTLEMLDEPPKRTRTTGLEELFYGILEAVGDKDILNINMNALCPICATSFDSNLKLQIHLMSHIEASNQTGSWQCLFCLQKFEDENAMKEHDQIMHPVKTKNSGGHSFYCVICQIRVNSQELLELHLKKNHLRLEMPYKCGACGYRTSSHKDVVLHFYEKHENTNVLQCTLCLTTFRIHDGDNFLEDKIEFYFLHMQQHSIKMQNKKCNKCALSFLQKGLLKFHQMFDHNSFAGNSKVLPLMKSTIKTPVPRTKNSTKEEAQYIEIETFPHLNIEDTCSGFICSECDTEFTDDHHISGVLKCLKCQFQTCCLRKMLDHTANCQSHINPESNVHITLDKEMHCVCGFSSSDGNSVARHLALCEHKSAYPSVEAAQENTVKRNMLDMLGLVRRDGDSAEPAENFDLTRDST